MKVVLSVVAAAVIVVALVSSASGHNMEVTHPQTGQVINTQWVGGPVLPAQAQGEGLFFHPAPGRNQPAGHREGLPHACQGTQSSPAVSITSPPFFTGCVHGQP
jgi:hypothetical protein